MSNTNNNNLDQLADDAWSHILSFLKMKHIIHRATLVNKRLYSLITCEDPTAANQLWHLVCKHQRVTVTIPQYNSPDYSDEQLSVLSRMGIPKITLNRHFIHSLGDDRWQETIVDKKRFIDYMRAIGPVVEDLNIACQTPLLTLKVRRESDNDYDQYDEGWEPFELTDDEELIERNDELNKQLDTLQFPQLKYFICQYDNFELHHVFFNDENCSQYRQVFLGDPRFVNLETFEVRGDNRDHVTTTLVNSQSTLKHFKMSSFSYNNNQITMLDTLSSCPKLETMNLMTANCTYTPGCFNALKSLDLCATYNTFVELLAAGFPQLTRLYLHVDTSFVRNSDASRIKPLHSLEYFEFSDTDVGGNGHLLFEAINPGLKELVVSDNSSDRRVSGMIAHHVKHLTKIEKATLTLSWTYEELEEFLKQNINMHTLTLHQHSPPISTLVQLTPQLKSLSLNCFVTSDDFKLVLSSLPLLRKLRIETEMSLATVSSILAEYPDTSVTILEVQSRAESITEPSEHNPTGKMHQFPALEKLLLEVSYDTVNDWVLMTLASHQVNSLTIQLYNYWGNGVTSVPSLSEIVRRVKIALEQTIPSDSLLIPGEDQERLLQVYQHLFTDETTLASHLIHLPAVRSLLRTFKLKQLQ